MATVAIPREVKRLMAASELDQAVTEAIRRAVEQGLEVEYVIALLQRIVEMLEAGE